MFEGRFFELLIIFVLALVVLGPEKLPRVVSEVGRWVGRARAMARQFREQLEEEVILEETRRTQQASAKPEPAPQTPTQPTETSQHAATSPQAQTPHQAETAYAADTSPPSHAATSTVSDPAAGPAAEAPTTPTDPTAARTNGKSRAAEHEAYASHITSTDKPPADPAASPNERGT